MVLLTNRSALVPVILYFYGYQNRKPKVKAIFLSTQLIPMITWLWFGMYGFIGRKSVLISCDTCKSKYSIEINYDLAFWHINLAFN